ncbi:hypothetical protein NECAME_10072 [Necator americanus]|uniref:Uncharacterized protein n=1 Tax=Necator americanus TaxID=51031 RepID=W2TAL1_NECAM|nr:hypothetical protein NECAME_10072 [Necator americanus]ETN79070.1 hypothetical protein NECAME_10072 [Necator americanus]
MNNPGRIGICASSSREDVSRSRNTPVRRASFNPQDALSPSGPFTSRGLIVIIVRNLRKSQSAVDLQARASSSNEPSRNSKSGELVEQLLFGFLWDEFFPFFFACTDRINSFFSRIVSVKVFDNTFGQTISERKTSMDDVGEEIETIQTANVTNVEEMDTTEDAPHFPGFMFDPLTRKHFRIAADHSGINNYTHKDIVRRRRETDRCHLLAQKRSFHTKRSCVPTIAAVQHLSLGARNFNHIVRSIYENRLLSVGSVPNAVQETYLGSSSEHVKGCQFLDIVGNGDDAQILGCWAIGDGSRNSRKASKLACLRARFDDDAARRTAARVDKLGERDVNTPLNALGLDFVLDGETVDISEPVLVDMTVAPVDSDVTCVLYVTAESRVTEQGILSMCNVVLQPMSALCTDDDDFEVRNSPIYNIRWSVESSAIYSCAWNSNKTRIALGMEDTAKIMDVITEKSFVISSRRRNVISQHFTSEGDLIYMGLRDSDVILSDLRMKSHHVTGSLRAPKVFNYANAAHMQALVHDQLAGFDSCDCHIRNAYSLKTSVGKYVFKRSPVLPVYSANDAAIQLKLYDLRRSDRELMSFSGHRNTHFRLPCTVDCQENFVFAVGSDGCTRGWSLASGDQLCAVPCPRPVDDRTDFPRVVYSSAWAGRAGSSALVLAVGDSLRIHHVEF